MSAKSLRPVARTIHSLRIRWNEEPDERLLAAYARTRDPQALTVLVSRHGPAVLAVCRRLLRCPHDAEDAFQTTFLTLARKASRIKGPLGGWLYTVAVRTTVKLRVAAQVRVKKERSVEPRTRNEVDAGTMERDAIVAREVSRLPDMYRDVVVWCDLRGSTRAEAARVLGCPEGTIAGRLARARQILARRLARLGIHPGVGAISIGCLPGTIGRVPRELLQKTIEAAAESSTSSISGWLAGLVFCRRGGMALVGAVGIGTFAGLGVSFHSGPPNEAEPSKSVAEVSRLRLDVPLVGDAPKRGDPDRAQRVNIGYAVATASNKGEVTEGTVTVTVMNVVVRGSER